MLRLQALLLLLLLLLLLPPPPAARAREPSAQDVSLGVVSPGVRGLLGSAGGPGRGKLGPGLLGSEDAGGSFRDPEGTGMGTVSEPQFLDPSGDLAPEFGDLERGWSGEAGTLGSK